MNKFSATIAFFIGGLLLSSWIFDGFWSSLILTGLATLVGFVFDTKRAN